MRHALPLLCFTWLIALSVPAAAADDEADDPAPESMTPREARALHCVEGHLTRADRLSCALKFERTAGRPARAVVYEQGADKRFVRGEQILLPPNTLDVIRVSFLRVPWLEGRDFLVVDFDGNEGTGCLQDLAAFFSWRDGHLALAWLDTRSYHEGYELS